MEGLALRLDVEQGTAGQPRRGGEKAGERERQAEVPVVRMPQRSVRVPPDHLAGHDTGSGGASDRIRAAVERVCLREAVLLDPEAGGPSPGGSGAARRPHRSAPRAGRARARGRARRSTLGGPRTGARAFWICTSTARWSFMTRPASRSSLAASSAELARHGTTAFLATTVAWAAEELGCAGAEPWRSR